MRRSALRGDEFIALLQIPQIDGAPEELIHTGKAVAAVGVAAQIELAAAGLCDSLRAFILPIWAVHMMKMVVETLIKPKSFQRALFTPTVSMLSVSVSQPNRNSTSGSCGSGSDWAM